MNFFSNFKVNEYKSFISSRISNKKFSNNNSFSGNIFEQNQRTDTFERSYKRINDLDSNLLNNNLVKFLSDDSLRIELIIETKEKELKEVESEIKVLELLEIKNNNEKINKLKAQQDKINKEIEKYKAEYRELGLIYRIADTVAGFLNQSKLKINEAKIAFLGHPVVNNIKSAIPSMQQNTTISQTLEKFCTVNSSLNKMLAKTVNPFGESNLYTDEFVSFMSKANKLDFTSKKILNNSNNKLSFGERLSNNINKLYSFIGTQNYVEYLKNNPITKFIQRFKDQSNN